MANMPRVLYYRTDKATGERVPSGWAEVRFRLQHLLCENCLAEACPGETIVFNQETGTHCWLGTDHLALGVRAALCPGSDPEHRGDQCVLLAWCRLARVHAEESCNWYFYRDVSSSRAFWSVIVCL